MSDKIIKIDASEFQDEINEFGDTIQSQQGTFTPKTVGNKKFQGGEFVLIIDESASMLEHLENGKSKKEAVYQEVENFQNIKKIFFSNSVKLEPFTESQMLGTRLGSALDYCIANGHHKAIIITDGDTWDRDYCLSFKDQINMDVIFVGTDAEWRDVKDFLTKLTEDSGGSAMLLSEVAQSGLLTEKINQLLIDYK